MNKKILEAAEMLTNKTGGVLKNTFEYVESLLKAVAETKFEKGIDLRVSLDHHTGDYTIYRRLQVVEDSVDSTQIAQEIAINQIPLQEAKQYDDTLKVGDVFEKRLPNIDLSTILSRVNAQNAKGILKREIRKAERMKIANRYQHQLNKMLPITVKRKQMISTGAILELDNGIEALLPHDQMIPREEIRLDDRLYTYLYALNSSEKGPQLMVSRTAPELLIELFKLYVREVDDGIIMIKSLVRDPGFRAKVAIKTNHGGLDPIATCIGRSGEKIKSISKAIHYESVDIILWDEDPAKLAIQAIEPATVISVTMDEETKTMDIGVSEEDLPRAIGQNGQNVRLASKLIGWTLNLMTEQQAKTKNKEEIQKTENRLMQELEITAEMAALLVAHDISTSEEIIYEDNKLKSITNLSPAQIEMLQDHANNQLLAKALSDDESLTQPEKSNLQLPLLSQEVKTTLMQAGIQSREALAELDVDDLMDIMTQSNSKAVLTRQEAGNIIMQARAHWFDKTTS